jgi:large subunit ribosomal protein L22e/Meckel syndrome type 1 protein
MRGFLFALSALAACTVASSTPAVAAARNYDCSKPGNANKAACKNAAKQSAKPTKAAPAPKAKEAKAAAPKPTPAKAAPKQAAATSERHYDCSKAGNANKAACKGAKTAVATAAPKAAPAKPAPKPAAMPKAAPKAAPAATSADNNIAAGAIAQCKDGTYSHAKNHRGACSRHGGVGKWLG